VYLKPPAGSNRRRTAPRHSWRPHYVSRHADHAHRPGLQHGQPLTLNIAYNRAPPGRYGEVAGLRLTVNNITHLGLPVVAGAMGAFFGAVTVFWIAAGILAACSHLVRKAG
jgi:hypothetical protein